MNDDKTPSELTHEERLKALAYQFVKLYDRMTDERMAAVQQAADSANLVKLFTEQVNQFKELEPQVREHIRTTIRNEASQVAKRVAEETSQAATRATASMACELDQSVKRAGRVLEAYQTEVITTQWKVISIAVLTTLLTCLCIVWFLMPRPMLPLPQDQLRELQAGKMLQAAWPTLSKKERQRLITLAHEAEQN